MAVEVKDRQYAQKDAERTRIRALMRAATLQKMAGAGRFNSGRRTVDIEQEVFVLDRETGAPLDVEQFMLDNTLGVRSDTTVCTLEYDANGITPVTTDGIYELFDSFQNKTKAIQQAIYEDTQNQGILVGIGTQPLIGKDCRALVVKDPQKRGRYDALEETTFHENTDKIIELKNPVTGEAFQDKASNLTVMTRCAATQLHLAFPTFQETLEAYNISIALAGPMIALFSNSPYVSGVDTGLASSRTALLLQAEQKRSGLALPANTIVDHYFNTLMRCLPPFIEVDDDAKALELVYGAMHISTRIRLDEETESSRIEFRVLDSMVPYRAMQALTFVLGAIEGLRGSTLPSFRESQINYLAGKAGLQTDQVFAGRRMSVRRLLRELIDRAELGLDKLGIRGLDIPFLNPLRGRIGSGMTQADSLRTRVQNLEEQGMSRGKAIVTMLNAVNRDMMEELC